MTNSEINQKFKSLGYKIIRQLNGITVISPSGWSYNFGSHYEAYKSFF